MLNVWLVACASLAWLAVMFGVALYAERRPGDLAGRWRHVYVLSLAVHCTSWTFYGTATQIVRHGWVLPPALLGVIAFHLLAAGFLLRLVRLSRETRATSLADLIATRLGKDAWLAAMVTFVALLGLIPYIGLQLRAVSMSFSTVTASDDGAAVPLWRDGALYVALAMAVFAMLFGARRADANGHNRGLVLAMAFESLFKLVAMLVLGGLAWVTLERLPAGVAMLALPARTEDGFVPLLLLGFVAVFVLPHQFHMGVIECRNERDVRTARWMFPLYLLLIALPAVPLALAGRALLGEGTASDMYALALPLAQGHEGIALFVFLGGLSAATGMVVVSTLTLSLMIGNHWLMPGLLHSRKAGIRNVGQRSNLLRLRRSGIVVIMLAAWAYSRFLGGDEALADAGATSFSVLSTLAPALCLAVWWPRTPAHAVRAGILAGVATWAWISLLPVIAAATGRFPGLLADGPFGIGLLSPDNFFGLGNWSVHGRAFGASLFVNLLVVLGVALHHSQVPEPAERALDREVLEKAGLRFLARKRVSALLAGAPAHGPVPRQHEKRMERELSGVLGAASARLLLDAARNPRQELDTVAAIVSEASQELRFNQQMLMAALRNMSQGVSVIDGGLRLVAWNPRYVQLFGFPDDFLQIGKPIEDVIRWTLERMPHRGSEEAALTRRLMFMRAGTPHLTERVFPDGSIIEIRGNPMPGGGFVATYTDITVSRNNERELKRINETLEQRVAERTALLESAKREAEHANDAKSRFLTAIGHDLLQPLHAAHLFTDALAQQMPDKRENIEQLRGALDSTTDLLNGLLDMSRLEAGGLLPEPRDFPLAEVLDPLASEFRVLAGERGLGFTYLPTRAWTHSDPQLLRRILQNFLANAVRYTRSGGIVFGVRRANGGLRVEVHDTGPGIGSEDQQAIFEEFRRGVGAPGQGLGLGLSIADRIAKLLQAPLSVRSRLGRGSVFAVELPLRVSPVQRAVPAGGRQGLAGKHVLAVDNDPLALSALEQLLRGWGCEVEVAGNGEQAEAALARMPADVWLFDYHLDDGDTGVELWKRLSARFGGRPCLILSADQSGEVRRSARDADLPMISKPVRPLALKSVLDRVLAASSPAFQE